MTNTTCDHSIEPFSSSRRTFRSHSAVRDENQIQL